MINKLILLVFGTCSLLLGLWLYKTNSEPKAIALISVEIGGFITAPGVYRLPVGSRVSDLIQMAGGTTKEPKDINRVAILKDGQKINIK